MQKMKKLLLATVCLLVCVIVALCIVSCGKNKKNKDIEPATEAGAPVVEFQNTVVIDEELYSVVFVQYDTDEFGNFYIDVLCENRLSDKVLVFSIDRVSVNNYMIDPWWAVEVKPGCASNSTIVFSKDDLDKNNIDHVININFDISVYNSDDLLEDSIYEENFDLMVE